MQLQKLGEHLLNIYCRQEGGRHCHSRIMKKNVEVYRAPWSIEMHKAEKFLKKEGNG